MIREEKYDAVNACKTLDKLAKVIESFADENGSIQGRTRSFDAKDMALACLRFQTGSKNKLTREFGIRQQAMMIEYYM